MYERSFLSQIVLCGQRMCQHRDCSLWATELSALGCLVFGLRTLPNIRFHQCFQDQTLHTYCAENQGSWNGNSPTRPRILHQKLFYHHTLVTASLFFHKKQIFAQTFSSFRRRFRKGCRRKNTSLLKILAGMTAPSYPGSLVCRRRCRSKRMSGATELRHRSKLSFLRKRVW